MSRELTMSNSNNMQGQPASSAEVVEEINLIDIVIVLAKYKGRIIGMALLAALVAAGASLLIPNTYTSRAQILPPQGQSGSAALLGQLGALGSLAGGSLGKGQSETYVAILNSRRVSDSLVQRFNLRTIYDTKSDVDTRARLQGASAISSGKDGLLVIEVSDTDPKLAAAMANAYVEELQKLTQVFAITEASQRRLFFEKQLEQAKQGLTMAEVALKEVQQKTGLIQLSNQAEGILRAVSALKAQIAAKEVAMGAMRTFATAQNPQYRQTQQELIGLQAQLAKIETGMSSGKNADAITTSKVPEAGLEYMRRVRDVKYYETIFELLAKQFEVAKIDEAKEGSLIQVLDTAIPADKKSKPQRSIFVILAFLAGAMLTICWAFLREMGANLNRDPRNAVKLQRLRLMARWTKRKNTELPA